MDLIDYLGQGQGQGQGLSPCPSLHHPSCLPLGPGGGHVAHILGNSVPSSSVQVAMLGFGAGRNLDTENLFLEKGNQWPVPISPKRVALPWKFQSC